MEFNKNAYKPVPDFPDYYATESGDILSTKGKKPRIMHQYADASGYKTVFLRENGEKFHKSAAFVVFTACSGIFFSPDSALEVSYLDGDPSNVKYENLYLKKHKEKRKTVKRGKQKTIVCMGSSGVTEFPSMAAAARSVNGSRSVIYKCIRGDIKTAYGCKWGVLDD